ncbi:pilin [Pseudidiomarina homiensis]|uniref:Methylation site containing protein n=1 Tax=Pseudidiomarina homiensis TaxID=364198 RepID=A0A432Y611_9GAMM|nr:prepilin-type N-terminal cleavage/methylation domain-containing protein [Pseudidiomarina homiensis]RUO56377.1 methylation site containing protein [Pseudidiomarina homiensis]
MKAQIQKGFTLIELMIVVAIIGILAAVAIPLYSDYTQRAKASTGISALASYKSAISICYQREGDMTECDQNTNGIPDTIAGTVAAPAADAPNGIISVTVADGVISATLDATPNPDSPATGDRISIKLVPTAGGGSNIAWKIACDDFGDDSRVDGCEGALTAFDADAIGYTAPSA